MKDYIKINEAIDNRNIKYIENNLQNLLKEGCYPKKFIFPITIQFELTGRCNLKCKHCYNRSGDSDRVTRMTPEEWCKFAKYLVKNGGIFQCILSGGEPLLLGDKLFDIMDILDKDGTSFVIITNGLLLTNTIVKRLANYRYYWFQISLDGVDAETHDSFRGLKGSWIHAVQGAINVSNAGMPLVIAHTVTPQNLKKVGEMVDFTYKLGASTLMLGEVLPSGRAYENKEIYSNFAGR